MAADVGAYDRGILAARARGLALAEAEVVAFRRLLVEWGGELDRAVTRHADRGHLAQLRGLVRGLLDELWKSFEASTRGRVVLTARDVAQLHARATVGVLAQAPGGLRLVPQVSTSFVQVGTRAAQAVLARPTNAAAFRSLRKGSAEAADRLIARTLLQGNDVQRLGVELRTLIAGAEGFEAAELRDMRRLSNVKLAEVAKRMGREGTLADVRELREEAGRISRQAALVARTEILNAEHEAGVQAAVESPVVEAVVWTLSNRHPERDECDLLAESDLYGLGAGTYDPRNVPPRPHPRCICGRRHVLRDPAEWGAPRGAEPVLVVSPRELATAEGFAPSRVANMERVVSLGRGGERSTAVATPTAAEAARAARAGDLEAARRTFAARQEAARETARSRRRAG